MCFYSVVGLVPGPQEKCSLRLIATVSRPECRSKTSCARPTFRRCEVELNVELNIDLVLRPSQRFVDPSVLDQWSVKTANKVRIRHSRRFATNKLGTMFSLDSLITTVLEVERLLRKSVRGLVPPTASPKQPWARSIEVFFDSPFPAQQLLDRQSSIPIVNIKTSASNSGPWLPGLCEVVDKMPSTSFQVQLADCASGSWVGIYEGSHATQTFYHRNKKILIDRALDSTVRLMLWGPTKFNSQGPISIATRRFSTRRLILSYLSFQIFRQLKRSLSSLIRKSKPKFQVEIFPTQWTELTNSAGFVLKNPKKDFLADPFLAECGQDRAVFFEQFRADVGRGVISCLPVEDRISLPIEVLSEPYHLSFPFTFSNGSDLLMCPESCAGRVISLYRCESFPYKWKFVRHLLHEVEGVDPLVLNHNNRWYLFATFDSTGNSELLSQLHIFSAEDLESKEWEPHPGNPVVERPRGGRNGGLIANGSQMIRIGQDHNFDEYGTRISCYEIEELTPYDYRERDLGPPQLPMTLRNSPIHHLSSIGSATALDFQEEVSDILQSFLHKFFK